MNIMFLRLNDISVSALPMSAAKLDFSKFVMWTVLSQQLIHTFIPIRRTAEVVRGLWGACRGSFVHLSQPQLDLLQPPDKCALSDAPANEGVAVDQPHTLAIRPLNSVDGTNNIPSKGSRSDQRL
jgi:hypothetical protein